MGNHEKIKVPDMCAAILEGRGIKAAAARMLGVSWETVDNYIKRHPTCKAAYDQAVHEVTDIAKGNVVATIIAGAPEDKLTTSKWWLKAKDPDFKDKSSVEHTLEPATFAQLVALARDDKD